MWQYRARSVHVMERLRYEGCLRLRYLTLVLSATCLHGSGVVLRGKSVLPGMSYEYSYA